MYPPFFRLSALGFFSHLSPTLPAGAYQRFLPKRNIDAAVAAAPIKMIPSICTPPFIDSVDRLSSLAAMTCILANVHVLVMRRSPLIFTDTNSRKTFRRRVTLRSSTPAAATTKITFSHNFSPFL